MRLEGVTAELRPRSDWEAVDLGLALVRRDFWRLFASWWLGMLPVLVLSPFLLRDYPVLLVLLWCCRLQMNRVLQQRSASSLQTEVAPSSTLSMYRTRLQTSTLLLLT